MYYLSKYLGGSHSYGLNTESSDIDYRGVFANTDANRILGLDRFDHQDKKEGGDECYFEVRNFLNLLRRGNTQAIEALFIDPKNLIIDSSEWFLILENRNSLLDTKKLFSCVMGYAQGERKLFTGERTGALGGKRKENIDKLGFSPKNYTQLMRLLWAATYFIQNKIFPVKIQDYNTSLHEFLFEVKTKPENYKKEDLLTTSYVYEDRLKEVFNERNITQDFTFNPDVANELLLGVYLKFLK